MTDLYAISGSFLISAKMKRCEIGMRVVIPGTVNTIRRIAVDLALQKVLAGSVRAVGWGGCLNGGLLSATGVSEVVIESVPIQTIVDAEAYVVSGAIVTGA